MNRCANDGAKNHPQTSPLETGLQFIVWHSGWLHVCYLPGIVVYVSKVSDLYTSACIFTSTNSSWILVEVYLVGSYSYLVPRTFFFMLLNHRCKLSKQKSQEVLHPVALWPSTSRIQVSTILPPGRTILVLVCRSRHSHSSWKFVDAEVPSLHASGISVCDGPYNVDMSVEIRLNDWMTMLVLVSGFFCNIPTAVRTCY